MYRKLEVNNTSIDTACSKKDYMEALVEYIWNGFDAHATEIRIKYIPNALG